MSVSDQELLHHLSRMPFVDTAEPAMILGEAHATVHRGLTELLSEGMVGRVSKAAGVLGFDMPSDFVRAYPVSREWLALLIRRMDAMASVYRLAASLAPGSESSRWGTRVTANHAGGTENAHPSGCL